MVPKNLQRKILLRTLPPIANLKWIVRDWKIPASLFWRRGWRMVISNENTVFQDAENLGIVPLLEPYSDKDSNIEQELANCQALYDIATYKKRRVCVTIKNYSVFDSSLQKRTKWWSKLMKQAHVKFILNKVKEHAQVLGVFMFVENCKVHSFCWVILS